MFYVYSISFDTRRIFNIFSYQMFIKCRNEYLISWLGQDLFESVHGTRSK